MNSKIALVGLAALSLLSFQSAAQAEEIVADFSQLNAGDSVEGLGTVHEWLDIQAVQGDGIAIFEGQGHGAYGAWDEATGRHSVRNGGTASGGFANVQRNNAFTFSFAPEVTVSEFSLEMMDYGDFNPGRATKHGAYLKAFDIFGDIVDQFSLEHQTSATSNDLANNIFSARTAGLQGDAFAADPGALGRTLMSVSGDGIARVELTFDNNSSTRAGMSSDPNLAFRALSFTADPSVSNGVDVPEPASLLGLLAVGGMGAGSLLQRKRQA